MLQPRTRPPELRLPLLSGGEFDASSRSPDSFTIIVFYRGKHCPICKTYLSEIERGIDQVEEIGAEIVAVSMDGEPLTTSQEVLIQIGTTARPYLSSQTWSRCWFR